MHDLEDEMEYYDRAGSSDCPANRPRVAVLTRKDW